MTAQIQRRLVSLEATHRGSDASFRVLVGQLGVVADDVLLREGVEGGAEDLLVVVFVAAVGGGF